MIWPPRSRSPSHGGPPRRPTVGRGTATFTVTVTVRPSRCSEAAASVNMWCRRATVTVGPAWAVARGRGNATVGPARRGRPGRHSELVSGSES